MTIGKSNPIYETDIYEVTLVDNPDPKDEVYPVVYEAYNKKTECAEMYDIILPQLLNYVNKATDFYKTVVLQESLGIGEGLALPDHLVN